ncbi:MAG: 50S ribosomal protein L31 [Acidimicrobiia bacterium]|nr:50S ribosomal protein L31 [Acidimicrobiia bacterium]MDH3469891.1 50S ribosomal protein L31 [Acidimicrobiia bacterium]
MKTDIHPEYQETAVVCSCGNNFTTRSVVSELHVELCNECHPFFTGKQKLVDSGGRVERFNKRYGKKSLISDEPAPTATPKPQASAEPEEDEVDPAGGDELAESAATEEPAAAEAESSEQGPAEEEA